MVFCHDNSPPVQLQLKEVMRRRKIREETWIGKQMQKGDVIKGEEKEFERAKGKW